MVVSSLGMVNPVNQQNPGRPRTLSRERIIAAARQVADTDGLDALSVRRVAQLVGAGQASLYRHIASSRELEELLAEDVAVELPRPRPRATSREQVLEQWTALHGHLSQHVWAARIIASGEHAASGAASFAASSIEALENAGLDADESARAYRALWNLTLGHVLNAHLPEHAHASSDALAAPPPTRGEGQTPDFAWVLPRVLDGLLGAVEQADH